MPGELDDRTKQIIEAAVEKAQAELKDYPDIPEHYETISREPNMKSEVTLTALEGTVQTNLILTINGEENVETKEMDDPEAGMVK